MFIRFEALLFICFASVLNLNLYDHQERPVAPTIRYCKHQKTSVLTHNEFVAVCSKYSYDVDLMPPGGKIENMIRGNFVHTVFL